MASIIRALKRPFVKDRQETKTVAINKPESIYKDSAKAPTKKQIQIQKKDRITGNKQQLLNCIKKQAYNEQICLLFFKTLKGNSIYIFADYYKTKFSDIVEKINENYEIVYAENMEMNEQYKFFSRELNRTMLESDYEKTLNDLKIGVQKRITHFDIVRVNFDDKKIEKILNNNEDNLKRITKQNKKSIQKYFIKYLNAKITTIEINQECTVYDFKILILEKDGIVPDQTKLYFIGEELKDDKKLSSYNIPVDSTIYMVLKIGHAMYHETSGNSGNMEQFCDIMLLMDNVIGKIKI